MIFKFCPACGSRLDECKIGDEGTVPFCKKCARPWFSVSHPCVITLVVNECGEIALVKQNFASDERFVCVAGYIKAGETAEQAVCREVKEELGLNVVSLKFIKSYYFEKHDNLMLGFVCRVKKGNFTISDELKAAEWFDVENALLQLKESKIAKKLLLEYIKNSECLAGAP